MFLDVIIPALQWTHITAGFIGLITYWVPIFATKGSINHRRFGKIFIRTGYIVIAASLMSLSIKAVIVLGQDTQISQNIGFWSSALFLSYLALVTFVMLHHATEVLTNKKNQTALNTLFNKGLGYASIASSVGIVIFALIYEPPTKLVLFALSPIGVLIGTGVLGYISGRVTSKRQWFYEHMGVMITAGIAFHTAFFVFGASRIFDYSFTGFVAVIPWILPTVIGVPAAIIWERHYRNKFKDPKPSKQKVIT